MPLQTDVEDSRRDAVGSMHTGNAVVRKDLSLWQSGSQRRLSRDLVDSFRNPEFWLLSAWLDIVVTYRRSRLGAVWLLMPSAVYIWGVGTLFAGLWHVPLTKFAAHLALGWTIFHLMSVVTNQSTQVLFRARSFIMDGRVRLTDFVLRAMAKAVFHFLVSIPMVVLALAIYPELHPLGILIGLGGAILVLVATLAAGVVFAIFGARFPDVHEVISNLFRVLFLLTPIVWFPAQMPAGSVRGTAARFNPFFHLVEVFRAPMLGEPLSANSWYIVAGLAIFGFALAAIIYRRYARLVPIWL